MIQKQKQGTYRVRWRYGHNSRYKFLKKIKNPPQRVLDEIYKLEQLYGKPVEIKTMRSFNCLHLWQAKEVEEAFKAACELERLGKNVPDKLVQFEVCPERPQFIEELAYEMSSICGFQEDIIRNCDYFLFLEQADVEMAWVKNLEVTESEIKDFAISLCTNVTDFKLAGRKFLFIGSVVGFTGCEDYIRCLKTLAKNENVDGIITAGEWIKTIFLHKKGKTNTPLKAVKELASEFPIFAIRSNRDSGHMLSNLKEIGITFLNGIEDEKNLFTGLQLSRSSTKDQLTKYEDFSHDKNIFVFSSYVGLKSQVKSEGKIRYIVGSGSSGFNTPRSRLWAASYDTQLFKAQTIDNIGGHILAFDNKSNLYPTTFRYIPEKKAIFHNGSAFTPRTIKNGKLHLLISDFHADSHDRNTFTAVLEFIEKRRDEIQTLALNGDFLTNLVLNHYNFGDLSVQMEIRNRDMDFLKEIAWTKMCLEMLVSRLKKGTRLIFKIGNHEVNSLKKFLKKDTNYFLKSMLDLTRLLDLDTLGFEIIDERNAYRIGDIDIYHGHEMSRKQGRRMFGVNNVRGHSHGIEIDSYGMTLAGMESDQKVHYTNWAFTKWSLGFATITEFEDSVSMPQPVLVHGNKYFDMNKIITMNKQVSIELPQTLSITYSIDWTGREKLI